MTTILLSRTPPSVNRMYVNAPGKGRRKSKDYTLWIKQSQLEVLIQRPRRHIGRVDVVIRIPEAVRGDGDNRIKATLDLMKRQGVIVDDSRDFVRSTKVEFADIEQTEVIITDVQAEAA